MVKTPNKGVIWGWYRVPHQRVNRLYISSFGHGLYGLYTRNRNSSLENMFYVWILGPLGVVLQPRVFLDSSLQINARLNSGPHELQPILWKVGPYMKDGHGILYRDYVKALCCMDRIVLSRVEARLLRGCTHFLRLPGILGVQHYRPRVFVQDLQ